MKHRFKGAFLGIIGFCIFTYCVWLMMTFETANGQGLLVPVQPQETVPNNTGIQCVWSSLELIGNFIEEPRLYNLTRNPRCQGMSSASGVSSLLNSMNIKFVQTRNKTEGLKIMKAAMEAGIPVLCGFNGSHAINVVHYDSTANRVHYIDNIGNRKPKIMSLDRFNKAWDGWIVAIYPVKQTKIRRLLAERKIEMWYYDPSSSL